MTLAVEDDLFEVEVGTTELNNVDIEVWTTLRQRGEPPPCVQHGYFYFHSL